MVKKIPLTFKVSNSSNFQGHRVLSAAPTVRVRSYSDESIRDHRITGGSYDGPGKTTVSVLNQGRKEERAHRELVLSKTRVYYKKNTKKPGL